MPKQEIIDWLNTLPDDAQVGVDSGGLCLRVDNAAYANPTKEPYLEIGGLEDGR